MSLQIRNWLVRGDPHNTFTVEHPRGRKREYNLFSLIEAIRRRRLDVTDWEVTDKILLVNMMEISLSALGPGRNRKRWEQLIERIGILSASIVSKCCQAVAPKSEAILRIKYVNTYSFQWIFLDLLRAAINHRHDDEVFSLINHLTNHSLHQTRTPNNRKDGESQIEMIVNARFSPPFNAIQYILLMRLAPRFFDDVLDGHYPQHIPGDLRVILKNWLANTTISAPMALKIASHLILNYLRKDKHLALRNGNIDYLPNIFHLFSHLKSLDLSRNPLKDLPKSLGMTSIMELNLEHTSLPLTQRNQKILRKIALSNPGETASYQHSGIYYVFYSIRRWLLEGNVRAPVIGVGINGNKYQLASDFQTLLTHLYSMRIELDPVDSLLLSNLVNRFLPELNYPQPELNEDNLKALGKTIAPRSMTSLMDSDHPFDFGGVNSVQDLLFELFAESLVSAHDESGLIVHHISKRTLIRALHHCPPNLANFTELEVGRVAIWKPPFCRVGVQLTTRLAPTLLSNIFAGRYPNEVPEALTSDLNDWVILQKDGDNETSLRHYSSVFLCNFLSRDVNLLLNYFPHEVPDIFSHFRHLKNLDLSHSNLEMFPPSLLDIAGIETIRLKGNRLRTIPAAIGGLLKLKDLNLADNKIATLPETLMRCPIRTINLIGNPILVRALPVRLVASWLNYRVKVLHQSLEGAQ